MPIDPKHLLDLAKRLVGPAPGAVEADLRRGISTAYCALFHLLTKEAMTNVAVHRCCCGYPRHSQGKEPCAKSRKRLLWRLITVIPLTARLNGFGRESAAMTPRLFRPRAGVG